MNITHFLNGLRGIPSLIDEGKVEDLAKALVSIYPSDEAAIANAVAYRIKAVKGTGGKMYDPSLYNKKKVEQLSQAAPVARVKKVEEKEFVIDTQVGTTSVNATDDNAITIEKLKGKDFNALVQIFGNRKTMLAWCNENLKTNFNSESIDLMVKKIIEIVGK